MEHLKNPYVGLEGYNCFGCAPHNEQGLRMEFWEDDLDIVCRWNPREEFQGWHKTLHGGIQATLADEIASWVIFRELQRGGVTSKMEVKYLRPIRTDEGPITLRAHIAEQRRNIVRIAITIDNAAGERATEAECIYFTFTEERSREEFHFLPFKTEDEL